MSVTFIIVYIVIISIFLIAIPVAIFFGIKHLIEWFFEQKSKYNQPNNYNSQNNYNNPNNYK